MWRGQLRRSSDDQHLLPARLLGPPSAPELAYRAVRLILDGALDRGTEADLGGRLGISPRHLRRLFSTHLGVAPDGLARSARAHFARRLLDDTDLTMTEIALAAGFGSVRQFNRACRHVFRDSPRDLRARRRKADRLVADGGLLLRLTFHGPLDWDAMLAYFAGRAIEGVEHVDGDTYRRTIVVRGDPGVIELFPGAPGELMTRGARRVFGYRPRPRRAFRRHATEAHRSLDEVAERWRPWRALAATHLWVADHPRDQTAVAA